MAVLYWASTTSGNWEDRSRWTIGLAGPPAVSAPTSTDRVNFHPSYYGDCQINSNVEVADFYAGPFMIGGSCQGSYSGRINFNGKNFTSRDAMWVGDACSIIGMAGTTWTVEGDYLIIDSGIDANGHPKSCYYSFWTPPLTGAYRNLNMASPWTINVPGRSAEIYRASLRNVISGTGTPTLPSCGPTGGANDTVDYPYSKGVTAYFSEDLGSNTNVRFCPVGDPVTTEGELTGYGFLDGDIDLFGVTAFRVDGELTGYGFLDGDFDVQEYIMQIDGELTGYGFLDNGSSGAEINATEPIIWSYVDGELTGYGFLDGNPRTTITLSGGGGAGGGNQSGSSGFYCNATTPGPMDYRDQNKFKLTVGNTVIDFTTPYWTPGDIQIDYNGKILTFTEIATPNYARPSFNNEAAVTLEMDLGSGLTTYFRGKIKSRVHHGENHNEGIQYTAFGYQNLAAELDDYGPQGVTDDSFLGPWPVPNVIRRMFENNAFNLANNGIPATIGAPDENSCTTWTVEELSFKNTQFLSGVQQALKTEPARRVFFDDLQGAGGMWCFPNLETVPFVDIEIDLTNIDPHDFTVDTKNRWTALKVWVPFQIGVDVPQEGVIQMEAGWDSSYEADWNIRRGAGLDDAAVLGDAYRYVFRKWTFDSGQIRTESGGPVTALILVPYWNTTKWVPIQGDIDLQNGVFISKVPIVCGGNPNITGKAFGPLSAALVYVDSEVQPLPAVAWYRVPASGYTGTAYDWFGIAREKQMIMEPNVFTTQSLEQFTSRKLEVLKDVILTMDLPIAGDPIAELINLQAQVIIKNSARGLESVPGFVSKYVYTFGKPGKSTISLSTDRALVTRTD